MNGNQMQQILPVISRITGWGDATARDAEVAYERCGRVIAFTLTREESLGFTEEGDLVGSTALDAGFVLTLTRVQGDDTQWVLSSGAGEMRIINTLSDQRPGARIDSREI